ncbi:MAG TPA: pilus assembly PilX N-terminal domain-containing protein [Candidatus Saccharimonadales bacterium]|nr:pilus assembly PilX N-terminal domain-containing protein [Candidatus Saccharimonadales bacterium]
MINKEKRIGELGLASFIVTIVLMLVIGLIVIGFAQISRREQRESKDTQLNTQAYYAAESGVNIAIQELNSGNVPGTSSTACQSGVVGPASNISYSCLLINTSPSKLTFDDVSQNTPEVANVVTLGNTALQINWNLSGGYTGSIAACMDKTPSTNFPAVSSFPTTGCPAAGVLRLDILPDSVFPTRTNATCTGIPAFTCLQQNTVTLFLYPGNNGSADSCTWGTNCNTGSVSYGDCTGGGGAAATCTYTINSYPNTAPSGAYMRLMSIYSASDVTLSCGSSCTFANGQAQIDSTGKAVDVLKRILVNVPYSSPNPNNPNYAIQSAEDICKDFSTDYVTIPYSTPSSQSGCKYN